jgi:(S)-ureidoglycine aminohydrolase
VKISPVEKPYAFPPGGLPPQTGDPQGRAIFTTSHAVIPADVQRDIVTSFLPQWQQTRAWVLARPLTGFAETFAQYAIEMDPEGGSDLPEPDRDAQVAMFVASGTARLTYGHEGHDLTPGTFAYVPPGAQWSLWNRGDVPCQIHWIRKRYTHVEGIGLPELKVLHETDVPAIDMPHSYGAWSTQRFLDPLDMRYDMHLNIVTFLPEGRIPFAETHVMEHGLYVLQGTGRYLLNTDWVDVGPGDFLWLRAFCPQACVATGEVPFRYLLYKDVNRHPPLHL